MRFGWQAARAAAPAGLEPGRVPRHHEGT